MGTRNITRVKSGGQLKVCQYGQWDGYPTGAGLDIMDFIRRTDDAHMVERLSDVELHVCNESDDVYCTGYPATAEVSAILNDEFDFRIKEVSDYSDRKRKAHDYVVGKYGEEAVLRATLASRDTGCDALDLIYGSDCHIDTWTDPYLMRNDGDWQIEAVWELDYDLSKLTGFWHGERREWTFDQLRAMSEDEVVTEMVSFERSDYEEE